jgi:hypothetical protein
VDNILSLIIAVIGLVPAVIMLYLGLRLRQPGRSPRIMMRMPRAEAAAWTVAVDMARARLIQSLEQVVVSPEHPLNEERFLEIYAEAMKKLQAVADPALQHKDLIEENILIEEPKVLKELGEEREEFSDKLQQTTNQGVARGVYIHLLNYLSHEMQEEMKDYLDDGVEERSRDGKALEPFIISETLSLVLSIGKLKLFELRKSFRRKVS